MKDLSLNLATVKQMRLPQALEACARNGFIGAAPWRESIAEFGTATVARMFKDSGLRVTNYCRGGLFASAGRAGLANAIDDNKRMIEEAAEIGAEMITVVGGGLPPGSRDIAAARAVIADGVAAVLPYARECGVTLALEPLHPMYAAERGCVVTLSEALDIVEALDARHDGGLGVAIDVYHVWWDPRLAAEIARAGRRVVAHHLSDWLVSTKTMLTDRGMMGDGVIDLPAIRGMVEAAGYTGHQEVEIFSDRWWGEDGDAVMRLAVERFKTVC